MCSSPHDRPTPKPSRPYRLPMKRPDRADCASSVALGNVMPDAVLQRSWRGNASGGPSRAQRGPAPVASLHLQRRARCGVLLGIYGDPAPVLHLLDAHQVVAVIARAIEAQVALDGVDPVFLDPRGDRFVVEAVGTAHAGFENLPRSVGSGSLDFDRRIRDARLRGTLVIKR